MPSIETPHLSPIPVVNEKNDETVNQEVNKLKSTSSSLGLKNCSASVERKLKAYRERSNKIEDKTLIERVLKKSSPSSGASYPETKKQSSGLNIKKELKMIQNINRLFPDLAEETPMKYTKKKSTKKKIKNTSDEPATVAVLIPELLRRKANYVPQKPENEPKPVLDDSMKHRMLYGSPRSPTVREAKKNSMKEEEWSSLVDTIHLDSQVRGTIDKLENGDPMFSEEELYQTLRPTSRKRSSKKKHRSSSAKRKRQENIEEIQSRSRLYKDISYRPHINYGTRSPSKRFGFLSSYSKRYSIQRHLESYPLHQDCMRRLPHYDPNESLQRKRIAKRHQEHAHHIANLSTVRARSAERRRVYDQHGRSHTVPKRTISAKKKRMASSTQNDPEAYEPIQTNYFDDLPAPAYKSDANIVNRLNRIKSKITSPTLSRNTPAESYPTSRSLRRDPDVQAVNDIRQRINQYKRPPTSFKQGELFESPQKLRSDLSAIDKQIQLLESELALVT